MTISIGAFLGALLIAFILGLISPVVVMAYFAARAKVR